MSTLETLTLGESGADSLVDINNNFASLNTGKIETSVIDIDPTLSANSNTKLSSQQATKSYIDTQIQVGIVWQNPVLALQSAPPVSSTTGDRYIVLPTGTGAWSSYDNQVATSVDDGNSWSFTVPTVGWTVFNDDDNFVYNFNGIEWVKSQGSATSWGGIGGTLSNQTDLQTALGAKLATSTAASTYAPITSIQYKTFVTIGNSNADYLISDYIDAGDATNAAYADLPAQGGIIEFLDEAYSHVTPIVINTAEKFALLRASPAGGTTLTYTGTGKTIALTYNISKAITSGYGIQGVKFVGPGSAGNTVGIQLGGLGADDGKGFAGGMLRDVHVRGFGCNILIGNNVFCLTLDNVTSNFGGKLLYEKGGAGAGATDWTVNGANTVNSGENMRMIGGIFADADNQLFGESTARYAVHLQTSGLTDWNFIATSFDDAELYVDKSGGTGNQIHLDDCHFENPAGDSIGVYNFITGLSAQPATTLDITNTVFVQDKNTTAPSQLISFGGRVSMTGCSAVKNSGSATVGKWVNFINADATNSLSWFGCTNLNSAVTNIAGSSIGSLPFSGAGLVDGTIAYAILNNAGNIIAQNTNSILDASTFQGANYGIKINNAYAYINTLGFKSGIIIVPVGTFSHPTPILFGINGLRVSLRGTPGGGTTLSYTGSVSTIACKVNTGIQSGSPLIDHTSYEAIRDITFQGDATTSTNPKIGVYLGGTNGAAGAILTNVNIQGFGQGLVFGANTYHTAWYNGVIRNCAQLIYVSAPSNSGEALHFYNGFFVDPYNAGYVATNGVQIADSGSVSLLFSGCSFDDCQVRIGQANNVTFLGCHFENPAQANYGSYVYMVIDDNVATNVVLDGCTFWNGATTNAPTTYITNGGSLVLSGHIIRNLGGSTVTNFLTFGSSGRLTWNGFTNVGSAVTNIVASIGVSNSGFAHQSGAYHYLDNSAHPFYWATNTAGGTTGARTINRTTGTVNFAAGASSLVVTNSLVSASSLVFCMIRTNDTTALLKNVVPTSGSFTITLNANATAETSVGFIVIN